MFNRKLEVKMVKDTDATDAPSGPDLEKMFVHASVATRIVGREATKMIAATLILNAGCKILINRLSK